MTSSTIEDYFAGKPHSREIFDAVVGRIAAQGPYEMAVASQVSFKVDRKFAWFWLYNVTKKDPNGVPHLMLAIDRRVEDSHVRDISQVAKSRWNHQIVVRTLDDATSGWLGNLIQRAYRYGNG
jgi:hypothetical protein